MNVNFAKKFEKGEKSRGLKVFRNVKKSVQERTLSVNYLLKQGIQQKQNTNVKRPFAVGIIFSFQRGSYVFVNGVNID